MKKRSSVYNPSRIGGWRRFGSYIADAIIFIILSFTLYSFAVFPLTRAITPYDSYMNNAQYAFDVCQTMILDSKLVSLDVTGNEKTFEETFNDDLTYFLNKDDKDSEGHYKEMFAYFYVEFCSNKTTTKGVQINYDIAWVNNNVFEVNADSMFTLRDERNDKLAVLKDEAFTQLTNYKNGEINSESSKYHDDYIIFMNKAWEKASDVLTETDQYIEKTTIFSSYSNKVLYIYSYSSLIAFTVFFFLYYLLVPALFKKGQTLAKKILHVGVFTLDNKPIRFSQLLVRSILLYIFSFYMVMFVPLFILGANVVYLPLFSFGNSTFYMFTLGIITFFFSLVSGLFMAININHQALHDKVLGVIVLNENPIIKDDRNEIEENNLIENS